MSSSASGIPATFEPAAGAIVPAAPIGAGLPAIAGLPARPGVLGGVAGGVPIPAAPGAPAGLPAAPVGAAGAPAIAGGGVVGAVPTAAVPAPPSVPVGGVAVPVPAAEVITPRFGQCPAVVSQLVAAFVPVSLASVSALQPMAARPASATLTANGNQSFTCFCLIMGTLQPL
jgi:hypothetical protein